MGNGFIITSAKKDCQYQYGQQDSKSFFHQKWRRILRPLQGGKEYAPPFGSDRPVGLRKSQLFTADRPPVYFIGYLRIFESSDHITKTSVRKTGIIPGASLSGSSLIFAWRMPMGKGLIHGSIMKISISGNIQMSILPKPSCWYRKMQHDGCHQTEPRPPPYLSSYTETQYFPIF